MTKPIKHEPTVSLGNDLVRAAHNLKLIEKRLLMLAISRIDNKSASTGRNQTITLTVKDFLNEYHTDRPSTYREISKALDALDGTRVKFKNEAIGEHGTIHWTTGTRYKENEGSFVISINGDLFPYLHDLKSHFTTYKLHRVSGLKSTYTWRLFELLMQFKSTGLLNIRIDDFNHALETPTSLRANFANLRSRVIEPAVKEIREKDGLAIHWEAIKAGRKVKALQFTFPVEQQLTLNTHSKPSPQTAKRQSKSNGGSHAVEKDLRAAELSERQKQAEVSGLAQLEALAKQYGIELIKPKTKRSNSRA